MVGLVFGDLWPASFSSSVSSISTIMVEAHQRDVRDDQGFALDVIFQNETVCNFLFKEKRSPFFP